MPPVPRSRREAKHVSGDAETALGWAGRRDRRRCGSPDDDTPVPAYGGSVPDATPPTALTIAGSDSGGGAGAQADLKTFAALRVHGTCALTAVTAQNTAEVRGVVALEPRFVRQQVETVLDDFSVRSVKTGMLATAAIVTAVADLAAAGTAAAPGGRSGPGVVHRASAPGARPASPRTSSDSSPTRWSSPPTCVRRPCWAAPTSSPS